MNPLDPRIERFLLAIRSEGRSSPLNWHTFYEFLLIKKRNSRDMPPAPFILAALNESNSSKHARLGDQLRWAEEHGCLEEAISYLEGIPAEEWNSGRLIGGIATATESAPLHA